MGGATDKNEAGAQGAGFVVPATEGGQARRGQLLGLWLLPVAEWFDPWLPLANELTHAP